MEMAAQVRLRVGEGREISIIQGEFAYSDVGETCEVAIILDGTVLEPEGHVSPARLAEILRDQVRLVSDLP